MKSFRVFIAMVCVVMAALSVASCVSMDFSRPWETFYVGISVEKSATVSGLDVSFADGDAVGVYVLDASGKVLVANAKFTLSEGKWIPQTPFLYAESFTYYAYSPYKENVSEGVAVGDVIASPSFESVMGGIVSAWTPLADQSTLTNFLASDLCAAEGVAYGKTMKFSLKRRMGLHIGGGWLPEFSGNIPYSQGNFVYFVSKPDNDFTIGGITLNIPGGLCQEKFYKAESMPVDLGLPSGLKWAAGNVGAENPQDYGHYFAWGETQGYRADCARKFDEDTYQGGSAGKNHENNFFEVYDKIPYPDGSAASISADLTLEQDAAHAYLGGKWRMPTKDEYQELIDNCTSIWIDSYNRTGVAGRLFTSKSNGNSVFFPAAGYCKGSSDSRFVGRLGYYWSASWDQSIYAWHLGFYSGNVFVGSRGRYKYSGRSVRGVCK